jgi:deoxyribodipyrimidine photo-lyase
MPRFERSLVWFRRDLRIGDHAALHHALRTSRAVYCVFVFDTAILQDLPRRDRRVGFIRASVAELDAELRLRGGMLITRHGDARNVIPELARRLAADAVFVNRDYEPAAISRDAAVARALETAGIALCDFKDQVIFEQGEIVTQAGSPFSVFTPYKNAWMKALAADAGAGDSRIAPYEVDTYCANLAPPIAEPDLGAPVPSLEALGFEPTDLNELGIGTGLSAAHCLLEEFQERIGQYDLARDFPYIKGSSYLSLHLRFGTLSIRSAVRLAYDAIRNGTGQRGAAAWLSELIWRDFYFMILHFHPHVAHGAFKPAYDRIVWEHGEVADALFAAWCEGRTGYPLVDAAMAQLNRTGYMHNRLRMVTASFLIKDLGIDWRRGERYFAEKLNDFDLAANNGGWQWAASSGCDAQPYFRIFNPVTQSEKFDAEGKFIRRYLPQLAALPARHIHAPWLAGEAALKSAGVTLGEHYPFPIVRHDEARARTLQRYAIVKQA